MNKYHYNKDTKKMVICRAISDCKLSPVESHGENIKQLQEKIKILNPIIENKSSPIEENLIHEYMDIDLNNSLQGVYGAFNFTGECLYIGLSQNINERIKQHMQELKRNSKKKSNWPEMYKKNSEDIIWKILELVEDRINLNNRENYWWSKLQPLYNNEEPSKNFYKTGGNTTKRFPGAEKLREDFKNLSINEVSLKYNVTKSSVYGWIREYELIINKSKSLSEATRDFYSTQSEIILSEINNYTPLTVIANKYKIDRQELLQIFKENGVIYGYELSKTKLNKENILKELDNKLTLRKISSKYGIIHNHLKKMLKEYEIKV